MKNYKVTITDGLNTIMDAEDKEELLKKISTGSYGIMPIRGKVQVKIIPENILKIEEVEQITDKDNEQ
jgi:hypothetical protein